MLNRMKGFTLIELLIVVAIIAILAAIAVPNFLEAQTRSKVARVQADLRSLATGVESYFVDNNSYPAQDSSRITGTTSGFGANNIDNGTDRLRNMPTFRRKRDQNDALATMTTPISYITSFFVDPFANTKRATFNYSAAKAGTGTGWIMWSYGPDTDEDQQHAQDTYVHGGDIGLEDAGSGLPVVSESYYHPALSNPRPAMTGIGIYDSTNGTTSGGDISRIKQ